MTTTQAVELVRVYCPKCPFVSFRTLLFERIGQRVIVTNMPGIRHRFRFIHPYAIEAYLGRLEVICDGVEVTCRECKGITVIDLSGLDKGLNSV